MHSREDPSLLSKSIMGDRFGSAIGRANPKTALAVGGGVALAAIMLPGRGVDKRDPRSVPPWEFILLLSNRRDALYLHPQARQRLSMLREPGSFTRPVLPEHGALRRWP